MAFNVTVTAYKKDPANSVVVTDSTLNADEVGEIVENCKTLANGYLDDYFPQTMAIKKPVVTVVISRAVPHFS